MADIVSKSEFAKRIGVSAARVSQMLNEGKISGEAVHGEGRRAKIDVEVACKQIGIRRDIGQSLGNGATTNLNPNLGPNDSGGIAQSVNPDHTSPRLQREPSEDEILNRRLREFKLRDAERKDRQAQEEELLRVGRLMKTDDAVLEMERIVGVITDILTGHPDRLGDELAAQFEIGDKRSLVFFLRNAYRDLRIHISDELTRLAEIEPDLVAADLLSGGAEGDVAVGQPGETSKADIGEQDQASTENRPQPVGA
ncbi:hypothetical protein SAMN04515647_3706 [Cohaesibacter sp. ES.047]|uniref:hypothetical protein n=1 Tax=Cohaesibacter sp. ES.047 TaxID=1798205 RepID=UPI000BB70A7C|nr:hypothetical protein [Cohaesibacter sp. ES.047]SNY93411.1 hypothetical protein SAMN04515647_3706 [Cohaesibacter sp. ES.047]